MRIEPINTDTQDTARLNDLRHNARKEIAAAIDHALRVGALTFERARILLTIVRESKS